MQFTFWSPDLHPINPSAGSVHVDHPILLHFECQVSQEIPFPLMILSTEFKSAVTKQGMNVAELKTNTKALHQLPTKVSPQGRYSFWYKLVPKVANSSLSMGLILLQWSRPDGIPSRSKIPIPLIPVSHNPFNAQWHLPPHAQVGEPFDLCISIENQTNFLQPFLLTISPNDFFVFSCDKQANFDILPKSTKEIKATLIPLSAGRTALPQFKLFSKRYDQELSQTKQIVFLFVKP